MFLWIVAAVTVTGVLWKRWSSKPKPLESFLLPDQPKDTVILHQFGAGITVPSASPFVIKLETYLRAANIPYVNKFDRKFGPKGKVPWIQYNDRVIPDSQHVIEFLNAEFKLDLNKDLDASQLATGHLVRRVAEESLFWVLVAFRLLFDPNGTLYRKLGLPVPFVWYARHLGCKNTWCQGIGRHTREEVTKIMEDDLTAISTVLGDKKFLFGDNKESITEFDCALFGQLCQLSWQMPGCYVENILSEKFPKLVEYCKNMKSALWSDWDQRLLHNVKKSAACESGNGSLPERNGNNHDHLGDNLKNGGAHDQTQNGSTTRERKSYEIEQ